MLVNTACSYMFCYSGIAFLGYMMCIDLPHKIPLLSGECVGQSSTMIVQLLCVLALQHNCFVFKYIIQIMQCGLFMAAQIFQDYAWSDESRESYKDLQIVVCRGRGYSHICYTLGKFDCWHRELKMRGTRWGGPCYPLKLTLESSHG